MPNNSEQIAARLIQIADELRALAEDVRGEPMPDLPKEAVEKMEHRICLQRGGRVPDSQDYTRGLSPGAYAETMRAIKSGELNERDLISRGLLAPKSKPGRKKSKSKLDDLMPKLEELKAFTKKASRKNGKQ